MKYKYPKSISIGDTKFKIIYDYKSDEGAQFSYPTNKRRAFIRFDMKNHRKNPEQFLNILIHELKEIIQIEQSTRMWRRGSDNYEFHYTHSEHTDLCSRLSRAVLKFIK